MPQTAGSRLAWVAAFLLSPASAQAADLVVDAASNFVIDARINGQPVRLRVDPETSGYVILNPETVARIGLRRSMMGSRTRIGPVRLTGSSKVAEVSIGGVTGDRRVVWIDRPAIEGADGLIGPADMPYDRVTFSLGAPRDGETAFVLPMEFERSFGLFVPLILGERAFRFQFSLTKPATLATAGAGAQLASLYGGGWTGEARNQMIEFGVVRPVRPLALQRPVELQGFRVGALPRPHRRQSRQSQPAARVRCRSGRSRRHRRQPAARRLRRPCRHGPAVPVQPAGLGQYHAPDDDELHQFGAATRALISRGEGASSRLWMGAVRGEGIS